MSFNNNLFILSAQILTNLMRMSSIFYICIACATSDRLTCLYLGKIFFFASFGVKRWNWNFFSSTSSCCKSWNCRAWQPGIIRESIHNPSIYIYVYRTHPSEHGCRMVWQTASVVALANEGKLLHAYMSNDEKDIIYVFNFEIWYDINNEGF